MFRHTREIIIYSHFRLKNEDPTISRFISFGWNFFYHPIKRYGTHKKLNTTNYCTTNAFLFSRLDKKSSDRNSRISVADIFFYYFLLVNNFFVVVGFKKSFLHFPAQGAGGLQFKVEPQDVVVEMGGSARLDCQATSVYGQPTIQWRSDDGQPINFIGDSYR